MASAFYSTLEKTLQCPVCKNSFHQDKHIPKELPNCPHICCQPCLEELQKATSVEDIMKITCPECRTVAYIPSGSVPGLKTNQHLLNIAQAQREYLLHKQQQRDTLNQEMSLLAVHTKSPSKPASGVSSHLETSSSASPADGGEYVNMRVPPTPPPPMVHDKPATRKTDAPSDEPYYSSIIQRGPAKNQQDKDSNPPLLQHTYLKLGNKPEEPAVNASGFGHFDQLQAIVCTPDGLVATCDFNDRKVRVFEKQCGDYTEAFRLELRRSPNKPADLAILKVAGQSRKKDRDQVLTASATEATYVYLVARRIAIEMYTNGGKYIKSIKPCDTTGLCNVTTTDDGRILAGDITTFNVMELDNEGALIRTVKVKTKPARIQALNGSLVAVSHFRTGRVEIIDLATESSIRTLKIPEVLGMCYLRQSNTILVARSDSGSSPGTIVYNTGKVQQYCCATGQYKGTLIDGLYHPLDITYTKDGLLAIADEKTIRLYGIKNNKLVLYE